MNPTLDPGPPAGRSIEEYRPEPPPRTTPAAPLTRGGNRPAPRPRPGGGTARIPAEHRAPHDPADRVDTDSHPPETPPKNRNLEARPHPEPPSRPPEPAKAPRPSSSADINASTRSASRIDRRTRRAGQ